MDEKALLKIKFVVFSMLYSNLEFMVKLKKTLTISFKY